MVLTWWDGSHGWNLIWSAVQRTSKEVKVKLTKLNMEGSTIHWFNLSKQAMIERYKGQRVDGSPAKWKKCQRVHSRIWIHFVSGGLASRRTIPLTHITDLRWWSWLEMWRWMCEKPRRLIFMEQRTLGGKWWWIGERWLWTLCWSVIQWCIYVRSEWLFGAKINPTNH